MIEKKRINEGHWQPKRFLLSSIVLASVLVLLIALLFILFGGGGGEDKYLICSLSDSHSRHMKISWLKSDNISSYEDIPGEEKENLSAGSERWLNISALNYTDTYIREYNPTEYQELSEDRKKLFRNSLNSRVYLDDLDENTSTENLFFNSERLFLNSSFILYQGDMYYCDIYRGSQGA